MSANNPERCLMTCTRCGKRAAHHKLGLCQRCREAAHIEATLDAQRKAREAVHV